MIEKCTAQGSTTRIGYGHVRPQVPTGGAGGINQTTKTPESELRCFVYVSEYNGSPKPGTISSRPSTGGMYTNMYGCANYGHFVMCEDVGFDNVVLNTTGPLGSCYDRYKDPNDMSIMHEMYCCCRELTDEIYGDPDRAILNEWFGAVSFFFFTVISWKSKHIVCHHIYICIMHLINNFFNINIFKFPFSNFKPHLFITTLYT